MRKIFSLLLSIALCMSLAQCPALQKGPPAAKDVHITAGKVEPGMTAQDVFVEVTMDNQPIPCRVTLTGYVWDGYWDLEADEPVPEACMVCLNVFYSLPEGYDVDNINITMDCDGGEYDGTGSVSFDDEGCVEAWSRAFYGDEQYLLAPVHIQVLEFAPGMQADQVKVAVTVADNPAEARVQVYHHTDQGVYTLEPTDIIPEDGIVRLDIFYYLVQGLTLEGIAVTADCPGGEYDGTGSYGDDADGRVEACSHIFYGSRAEVPTEPATTEPATTEPAPTETQPATTEATQGHVHNWEEVPGSGFILCEVDTTITYNCSCGQTKTETVPAPGHNYGAPSISPATCTDYGTETYRCTRCSHCIVRELLPLGHSWSDWVRENGRQHQHTCTVCGATESEDHTIPAGSVTCTGCGEDIIN